MSSIRKDNEVRANVAGTAVGTSIIYTYTIPVDTVVMAEAKVASFDADSVVAAGSAVFVSMTGARRYGAAAAAQISTNEVILTKVDNISFGATALTWLVSGNDLQLQLATAGGGASAYYTCEILLITN